MTIGLAEKLRRLLVYVDILDDPTDGLTAIKAEVEGLAGQAMRGTDSALLAANYTAERGTDNSTIGRAVTATLYVSANGSGADGSTWATAYTTIQDALDAASTDANDCTLILIAPHATFYDIDTTGDPTWSANVILCASYRVWSPIRNEHASATSVMKFTGKVALLNLAIFTEDSVDGIIITSNGFQILECGFNSEGTSGANTSVHLDGSAGLIRGGVMADTEFMGNVTHTTGIYMNAAAVNEFNNTHMHAMLAGIHIAGATSDYNKFHHLGVGYSAVALDLDAGNEQHFYELILHGNGTNVDDEVGDHHWFNIFGDFPITIEPADLVGTQINCGGAGAYGGDTELRAVADNVPFRIVGITMEPSANEWYTIRFSADSGASFYDYVLFDGTKREGMAAPSGTEYIFNKGTRISASAKSVTGGNNVKVWLEIQEI